MRSRKSILRQVHHRSRRRFFQASLEWMEPRLLLSIIRVDTTSDADGANGADTLSLRQAIEISNGTLPVSSLTPAQQSLVSVTTSPANVIDFAIPAAIPADASESVAVPGFDPSNT